MIITSYGGETLRKKQPRIVLVSCILPLWPYMDFQNWSAWIIQPSLPMSGTVQRTEFTKNQTNASVIQRLQPFYNLRELWVLLSFQSGLFNCLC